MDFVFLGNPASVHTVRWADGLRERGHRVEVVPNNEYGTRGLAKVRRFAAQQWRVRRLARRRGHVLVVQYVPAGIRALTLLGIHPRIAVAWGSDIYLMGRDTPRRALRSWQQGLFLRGCDAVIAPSEDLVRATVAAGAPAQRTRCVPFGVDLDRFRPGPDPGPLRSALGLGGRRVVASIRTIAPIYNQPVVVEALSRLPPDVVAVMGSRSAVPSEVERVVALARQLGVEDRVRIVPPIADEDLPDLYRLADVVVSIPATDGGPATLLEALACGRPVVATDVPSVREWLGAIDPSSLIPVRDAAATAEAIERVLERSPQEAAAVSARARAAVEQRGDRQAALAAMESLAALAGSSATP